MTRRWLALSVLALLACGAIYAIASAFTGEYGVGVFDVSALVVAEVVVCGAIGALARTALWDAPPGARAFPVAAAVLLTAIAVFVAALVGQEVGGRRHAERMNASAAPAAAVG